LVMLAAGLALSSRGQASRALAGLTGGAALGLLLLLPGALMLLGGHPAVGVLVPVRAFPAWAAAITVVVAGEEVLLRAAIQPRLREALGPTRALALCALVFAAIHVPLYGPVAIPLDIGVGLLLGCLREWTGSTAGCVLAHGIADIGAWWVA
jgi:membrane protease YdiL (CAAX protease family)